MAAETTQGAAPRLVAKIIASYVSHHNLAPEQIPDLIASVHRTIASLGQPVEAPAAPMPAVPVRRSVQRDVVICLDCGWKGKMLRRHLTTRHGLSGEDYLKRWGLPSDHPLTAPNYSIQRSNLAKELGLGRGDRGNGGGRRGRPRGS
ncbi:MAG TPA: MucR family transcriptional regulator [Stellaceae bacterium]|nr:MucR family transcriptional regulator [Stellaceae bacterium]